MHHMAYMAFHDIKFGNIHAYESTGGPIEIVLIKFSDATSSLPPACRCLPVFFMNSLLFTGRNLQNPETP